MAEKKIGIDISFWQGNYNLAQAKKEGVQFVILKAGGSDGGYYKDPKFERNYKEAKAQGLPVGAYYFCTLTSVNDAKNEAKQFLNCLKGKQYELPVYVDVEHKCSKKVGKKVLTDSIIEFCKIMEKNGYFVGIYSSKSYFDTWMDDSRLKNYQHWVAQWDKSCTYKNKDIMGMWQFGGETNKIRNKKIAGQTVDQDYMYEDFPTIIKNGGYNGFEKPKKQEVKKEEPKVEIVTKVETPKVEVKVEEPKKVVTYYAKCSSKYKSIVDALNSIKTGSSYASRLKIATKNKIIPYVGSASQNTKMLNLLKQGKLIKP